MKIPGMYLLSTSVCNFNKSCTNYLVWILGLISHGSSHSSTKNKNGTMMVIWGKELHLGQDRSQEAKAMAPEEPTR